MLTVILPEILAVDQAKRGSPRGHGGGPCQAWFSHRSRRWTMLSVVLPEILAVDHAKRGSPIDLGGGPCQACSPKRSLG